MLLGKRHHNLALALLCMLCLVVPCMAADYYVSPSGSDVTGNGTDGNPWYSINKPDADGILVAGDVVNILAGSYALDSSEQDAGFKITKCPGVTYRAQAGSVIDGLSVDAADRAMLTVSANDTVLEGLHVLGAKNAIVVSGCSGVTIRGCVVIECVTNGVCFTVSGCGKVLIANNTTACPLLGASGTVLSVSNRTKSVRFVNNILSGYAVGISGTCVESAIDHSNNLFSGAGVRYSGNALQGVAEFQADPMFANDYGYDFTLAAGSPATCAGVAIPGYSPAGRTPDLGAFQLTTPAATSWLQGKVCSNTLLPTPLKNALVEVATGSTSTYITGYTDKDGNYKIPVPAETASVTVTKDGCDQANTFVDLTGPKTLVQDFTLVIDHEIHTYYVDYANGSDTTGDGSAANPWQTFAPTRGTRPADRNSWLTQPLVPGDTVIVKALPAGQKYPGQWILTAGEEAAPVTFKAEPGVVMDGSVGVDVTGTPWGDLTGYKVGLTVGMSNDGDNRTRPWGRAEYVVIDGFEIDGGNVCITNIGSPNMTVRNCRIHGGISGIQVWWPMNDDWCTITNNEFYDLGSSTAPPEGIATACAGIDFGVGKYLDVSSNVFRDLTHGVGVSWGSWGAGNNWGFQMSRVVNNTFVRCSRAAIYFNQMEPSAGVDTPGEFSNNIVADMVYDGLLVESGMELGGSNNLFHNNPMDYGTIDYRLNYASRRARVSLPFDLFGASPMLDSAYKPQSGSPAVDSGADVGLAYDGNGPDRGAYESTSSSSWGSLTGWTRGGGGVPAVGTKVANTGGAWTFANELGDYGVLLTPGNHSITASYQGLSQTDGAVAVPGAKNFLFSSVSGTVTISDGSTSIPAKHAKVTCPALGATAYTDAAGKYNLVLLTSGSVSITASHPAAGAPQTVSGTAPGLLDIVLPAQSPGPKTYYVKVDGDDDGDGQSVATAWRTIDNGDILDVIDPGDTVIVKAGVYTNVHTLVQRGDGYPGLACVTRGGTAESPVIYQGEPGTILDGGAPQGGGIGFQTWAGADNVVVKGFEIRNITWGMNMEDYGEDGGTNVTVQDVVFHDIGDNAVQVLDVANLKFVRCTFRAVGGLSCFALMSGINGCEIYNCVAAGGQRGITLYGGAGTGVVVRNSIFFNNSQYGVRDPSSTGNLSSDYNVFFGCPTNYYGVAAGANDIYVDPQFVNAAAGDFRLILGSPCIDTGTDVGLPFILPAPDRGAFEGGVNPYVEVSLSDAKSAAVGTAVKVVSVVATVATGTFADGRYYVEKDDRTVGMMVVPAAGLPAVALGARVTIEGTIAVDANGEKYIAAASQSSVTGAELGTLGIGGKAIAGKEGLFVRVWGKVTAKTADSATIDDGSGVPVVIVLSGMNNPVTKAFDTTNTITVTGPAGLSSGGAIAVRPRSNDDIIVY